MPKYEAIVLLLSVEGNYIQPGEVFEIAEDDSDRAQILLAAGMIRPAAEMSKRKNHEVPEEQAKE